MIQELRLKAFQAHSTLKLQFDPGVNAIVGETDSGKSAVFRAIRWLVEHSSPTGYLKHGEKELRVGIKTEDGTVIRFKTPKAYGYSVNGQEFLACASKQPPEVSEVTGLSEINLQGQHDPPFLLTLTPGEFARALNRVVDLSSIDIATSDIKQSAAKEKTVLEHLKTKHDTLEARFSEIAWIPEAVSHFETIDSEITRLEALESSNTELEEAINSFRNTDIDFKAASTLVDAISSHLDRCAEIRKNMRETAIAEVKSAISGYRDSDRRFHAGIPLVAELERLWEIGKRVDGISGKISMLEPSLEILRKTSEVSAVAERVTGIIDLCERTKEAKTAEMSVRTVVRDIRNTEAEIAKLEASKGKLQEAIGPVCPTCGKPMKGK